MDTVQFESGATYTASDLAALARAGLEESGLSVPQAADRLNELFEAERGEIHRTQIYAALNNPEENPGMVRRLIDAFTDYQVASTPRFRLEKK